MVNILKGILIWSVAFTVMPLNAQEMLHRTFSINDLNPQGKISSLFESSQGLLLLSSENKLYTFDGKNYEEVLALPFFDNISVIAEDSSAQIIIGTANGHVYKFSLNSFKLSNTVFENKEVAAIKSILCLPGDSMVIGTYGAGLYFLFPEKTIHFNIKNGLPSNDIYDMAVDAQQKIWIGTDNGLGIIDLNSQETGIKILNKKDGLKDEIITSVDVFYGKVWIAYHDFGYASVHSTYYAVEHPNYTWRQGPILDFFAISNEIMVLTQSGQIVIGSQKLNSFSQKTLPVQSNIAIITKGKDNKFWILDKNQQYLQLVYPNSISYNIPKDIKFQAIAFNYHNFFYLGHANGVGRALGKADYYEIPELSGLNVVSLLVDSERKLWIGTLGQGLYRFDLLSKALVKFGPEQGLLNDNILSIKEGENHYWVCTLGGVFVSRKSRNQKIIFQQQKMEGGSGASFIYDLTTSGDEHIWVATDGKGLLQMDYDGIINTNTDSTLQSGTYYSVAINRENNSIWAVSANEGVHKWSENKLTAYTVSEGLRSMENNAVQINNSGNVFVWNKFGVDLLLANDSIFFPFWTQENPEEGNVLNLLTIDDQGQIWTIHDSKIHPLIISDTEAGKPNLWIQKATNMGNIIDLSKSQVFSYNDNFLAFHFKATHWNSPGQIYFRYKLEGLNTDWIVTADKSISFPGLAPGKYNFILQASLNPQFLLAREASYSFTIDIPFWKKTFFWIPLSLLVVLGTLAIIRIREKRIKHLGQIRNQLSEYKYDLLTSQINPHFLFNSFNVLSALIPKEPTKAQEFLETLSDFYREIVQIKDTDIITIEKDKYILERYYFLLKQRFGDALQIDIDIKDKKGFLIPFTLQLLLENAVKHNVVSGSKPLKLSVIRSGDFIYVKNNIQTKFSASESTGFGLSSLKERYQQYCPNKFEIINDNHYFEVRIPIIYK